MKRGVGIILVRSDGAILLQHRDAKPGIIFPNYWAIVGGSTEEGEEIKDAGIRELKEETGYIITKDKLTYVCRNHMERDGKKYPVFYYTAKYDGIQQIKCLEGQEIRFVMLSEISTLNIVPAHIKILTNHF